MLYHKNRTFNNSAFITLRYRLDCLLQCRALYTKQVENHDAQSMQKMA